jgi:hypothetical protein
VQEGQKPERGTMASTQQNPRDLCLRRVQRKEQKVSLEAQIRHLDYLRDGCDLSMRHFQWVIDRQIEAIRNAQKRQRQLELERAELYTKLLKRRKKETKNDHL